MSTTPTFKVAIKTPADWSERETRIVSACAVMSLRIEHLEAQVKDLAELVDRLGTTIVSVIESMDKVPMSDGALNTIRNGSETPTSDDAIHDAALTRLRELFPGVDFRVSS